MGEEIFFAYITGISHVFPISREKNIDNNAECWFDAFMLIRKLDFIPSFTSGDGCTLRELLNPANDASLDQIRYSLAHAMVPVGVTTSRHRLTSNEVYYIVSGAGIMHIDDERSEVNPGDTIVIPPGSVQFIENAGEKELEFLCIVDPAWIPSCETVLE
jgi:mannose-6-phosphate isomerase-like protein (cupin superfamily)